MSPLRFFISSDHCTWEIEIAACGQGLSSSLAKVKLIQSIVSKQKRFAQKDK